MNLPDIKFDHNGLIAAIIQDNNSQQVLMLGWMDQDAIQKTVETGLVTFWSRSRQKLWTKGETSKNFLYVEKLFFDCDQDAILILANPAGPTCHNGNISCFFTEKCTVKRNFRVPVLIIDRCDLNKLCFTAP